MNVFLLIGSNLGNRLNNLYKARNLITSSVDLTLIKASSIYETAAWGQENQDAFLNQALQISTSYVPELLLSALQSIEKSVGRTETFKWGPRIIDIDILLIDNLIYNSENLKVPHPEMQNRRFTLAPLAEIAPNVIHPVFQRMISELLSACKDPLVVTKLQAVNEI